MVGVGPAMPQGPMAGPPPMPDWMPPMPQLVKSAGSGTASLAISIAIANLQIIGYVTDGVATTSYPNGSPIADAEIWAYQPNGTGGMGAHTKTGTDGKFTLKVAQAGNYSVGAFKPGLPGVPDRSVAVSANDSVDTGATDGNTTTDVTVDNTLITAANKFVFKMKKPAYTISGKLTDGTNAVSYAPVWAYQSNGYGNSNTMTDASGNYILYVDNGTWIVNAYVPGYGDAESKTIVVSGSNMTQNLAPASTANYYSIAGTIIIGGSAQANMPIRAVEFNSAGGFLSKEYRGSTNSSGAYSISVPGTGAADSYKYYRVDIWTPTYGEVGLTYDEIANSPANIRVSNAATTTADIAIDAGNLITATISLTNKTGYTNKEGFINIDGVTCSGSICKPSDFRKSVRIADISGSDQTVQLMASSKYFFFLDVPGVGKYIPDLNANTGRDSTTGSVIATTTARTVKFTLPNATTNAVAISGTVTDASANPVANAWVWVGNQTTGYFNGTSTIANGTYSISVPIGTGYKTGAEKSGYMSGEPSDLNVSAPATKNFSLTASAYTISGYIYADANSNSSLDSGEEAANGWVRAETTDGAKKSHAPTDGKGYFELPAVNGTWKVYGMADGYAESQLSSNVTVSGSSQTDKNIKLAVDSSWANKSKMTPITPASGGTLDDSASSGTGVKVVAPPNALGSSASSGNITAAVTNAVTETNSNVPFSDEGTKITATDNSGQAITNLNDYIDLEKVIYKAEVAAEIAAGNVTLAKLKTMQNGYWDSTSNDWMNLATTRTAYYKTSSDDTEWILYSNASAADSFTAFIDTLIAGTTYGDYKLAFTSKTNHLTIFAIIMPFIITPASAAPSTPSSISPGGSVPTTTNYCSSITYDIWQTTCVSGYQYRNVLSRSPNNCVLTTEQESARKKSCGATLPEVINEVKEEIKTIAESSSQTAAEFAAKVVSIAADASEIVKANVNGLLGKLGFKRDLAKENVAIKKYVKSLIKDVKGITAEKQHAITNFITYGSETTTGLGEGERAGVLNSYKKAFGKLPQTEAEWNDAIKIANGRWPSETSTTTVNQAKTEFKKIYKKDADLKNAHDNAAITIIAYGLRPTDRSLNSEKTAIKFFKGIYGHNPVSTLAWDIIRAIAYSGAKR
ncbi:carboxypeptidase regulatory-like domain-containing protein [Candidatus Falkowbacteria bacterium]|nr:carboxypeptidase regulatory-like domain-containing protein [Candidatus Falkowbacteria bacterium]